MQEAKSAFSQLGDIIRNYIRHSVGDSGYGRAVEAIRAMREEAVDLELPGLFNGFMEKLKGEVRGGELGGDRADMWFLIRANRLGLIQRKECGASEFGEDEAKEFLSVKAQ